MKLNEYKLAGSFALSMAILWILCSAIVLVLPGFSMLVTRWWMHGLRVSVLGGWDLNIINFVLGGITATISAWVVGCVLGRSWNLINTK